MTSVSLGQPLGERAEWLSSRRAASAYIALGSGATGVYFAVPATAQGVLYGVIGLAAVAAIWLGAVRGHTAGRHAWQCFALGLLCEVVGDSISSVDELGFGHEPSVPSVVDGFYLVGYPLLALGIVLLLRARGAQTTLPAILDALIVFAAVGTVQWMFLVEPYTDWNGQTSTAIVSMAYPCMDVLLLVGFMQLLLGLDRWSASYWLLTGSVGLWVVGDEIFALTSGHYAAGDWVDAFWLLSYVAWGGAALVVGGTDASFRERRAVPRLSGVRLAQFAAALLAVPVALVVDVKIHNEAHPFAAAIGGGLIAAFLLLRLTGLVRTVDRARIDERRARWEAELAGKRIERQNEELRELDRLKDEFVSGVSHELRTPLTSIAGYVELLLDEEEDPDARHHLEVVQRNATRLLGLVSDLLFTARLQSGSLDLRPSPVDLRAVVEQAAESARPPARAAGVTLNVVAEDVPVVNGERDRLAQLVDNLVSNAIKFTPAGGNVDVSLALRNGAVRLQVSDDGIGIGEAERERLFERFFRAPSALERQVPGTGLGLYITKAIVEAHGGTIAVQDGERQGTAFVVELPVG